MSKANYAGERSMSKQLVWSALAVLSIGLGFGVSREAPAQSCQQDCRQQRNECRMGCDFVGTNIPACYAGCDAQYSSCLTGC
jgi:hypothetical protein